MNPLPKDIDTIEYLTAKVTQLEGELKEANSEVERYRGNYRASQQELSASREKMECGHPKACWTLKEKLCEDAECNADHAMMHTHPDGFYCTVCGELAAIRAECYERAASEIEARFDKAYQETTQFTASRTCAAVVRSLITSTDDAALAERDRRIRQPLLLVLLSIEEYWNGHENPTAMADAVYEMRARATQALNLFRAELSAPVPAERAGCHAGSDGDCNWSECPQLRDEEPKKTGRHCPLDTDEDARLIYDMLRAPVPAEQMNPADCSCEFDHCSDPTCRSKEVSHGAVKEKDRLHPAERAGDACPRCDGTRMIFVQNALVTATITCPDCHGTGKQTPHTGEKESGER